MFRTMLRNFGKLFGYFAVCFGFFCLAFIVVAVIFIFGIYYPMQRTDPELFSALIGSISDSFYSMRADSFLTSAFFRTTLQKVYALMQASSLSLSRLVVFLLALCVLAYVGIRELGEWLCRRRIRKRFEDEHSIRGFNAFLIRSGFSIAFWVATIIVTFFWSFFVFIIPILSACLTALKEILTSYFIYFKRYKFRQIVSWREFLQLFGVHIFAVVLQYTAIVIGLLHMDAAYLVLIVLPFTSYTSVVQSITSADYLTQKLKKQPPVIGGKIYNKNDIIDSKNEVENGK